MSDPKRPAPLKVDPALLREAMSLLDTLARTVGRQLGDRFDLDDLKAHAHEALSDVVVRFDPSRGVAFGAWARLRLRGAILDGVRKEGGLPRGIAARLRALEAADLYVEEKGEANGATSRQALDGRTADARLGSFLRGIATAYAAGLVGGRGADGEEISDPTVERTIDDPEAQFRRARARELLERAIDAIGDPEATILRRHYFMDEDLQDAAASLGLSKSWGSRLHARGIEKLAEKLREMQVEAREL